MGGRVQNLGVQLLADLSLAQRGRFRGAHGQGKALFVYLFIEKGGGTLSTGWEEPISTWRRSQTQACEGVCVGFSKVPASAPPSPRIQLSSLGVCVCVGFFSPSRVSALPRRITEGGWRAVCFRQGATPTPGQLPRHCRPTAPCHAWAKGVPLATGCPRKSSSSGVSPPSTPGPFPGAWPSALGRTEASGSLPSWTGVLLSCCRRCCDGGRPACLPLPGSRPHKGLSGTLTGSPECTRGESLGLLPPSHRCCPCVCSVFAPNPWHPPSGLVSSQGVQAKAAPCLGPLLPRGSGGGNSCHVLPRGLQPSPCPCKEENRLA